MNLGTMRTRVRDFIRDDQKEFIADEEVDRWLNDGQMELAHRLRLLTAEATEASAPIVDNTIPIPADYQDLISLRLGTDDVEIVPDQVFWSFTDSEDRPLQHTLGRVFNGNFELYPTPEGTAYTLRYYRTPGSMAVDADEPEVPVQAHIRIVYYAQAQAEFKVGEMGRGDRRMQMFGEGLPGSDIGSAHDRPGPMTFHRMPGPWDMDTEARHI